MSNKVYKKVNKYNSGSWLSKNISGITGALSGATSLVTDMTNALSGNQEAINNTKAGINQVNSTTFNAGNTSSLMSQWSAANYMDPVDSKQLRSDKGALEMLSGAATGASAGSAFGPWGALIGGVAGIGTGLAGWLGGKKKAEKKAKNLNEKIANANNRLDRNFETAVDNLEEQQLNNALMNYAAYGGPLETNGITWPSDLTFINNGGTHEQNPNEGIQIGVDNQGVPNLVEEGEVIYGDYVFSNRLKVPKEVREELKLGKKDITFADAVEKLAKESEERPNDNISKLGLTANLDKLIPAQENIRNKKQSHKNLFPYGGNTVTINGQKLDKTRLTDEFYLNNLSRETQDYINNNFIVSPNGNITRRVDKLPTITFKLSSSLDNARNNIGNTYNEYISAGSLPVNSSTITNSSNSGNSKFNGASLLRYAPVIGNALGLLSNKADYSNADLISRSIDSLPTIGYTPLGNYLSYNPMDINYMANKLNAQSGATRRTILNNSSGNRGLANASLLAADLNAQSSIGDIYRQALEYNQAQKQQVAAFNRATNQANAEMGLKADMANADIAKTKLNARMQEANMREQIANQTTAAKSANLTGLFDNLGAIGKEQTMIDMFNNNPYLLYEVLTGNYKKACGGKINRRRK